MESSVWSRSFARECHCASRKRRVRTTLSCSGGKMDSNAGMAHYKEAHRSINTCVHKSNGKPNLENVLKVPSTALSDV